MAKVDLCYAYLSSNDGKISSTELRGYLGYLFANDPEFHHHSPSSYHYPLVQYKLADSRLTVMGIGKYAPIVFERLSQIENIIVPNGKIRINNIKLETISQEITNEQTTYEFTSPWLALNSKNYADYSAYDKDQRRKLLTRILVANILSMLKGVNIDHSEKIVVNIEKYNTRTILAHENKFAGIFAKWGANILLPNYIGIGKSVSKGFGVIKSTSKIQP